MKYGQTKALPSAVYPDLLGTYEHELAAAFDPALARRPSLVVDVVAADGYYAVGIAFRDPTTRVIAYDQDPCARAEFANLTDLSGVTKQFEIRGRYEPAKLGALKEPFGLKIADYERYEDHALSKHNITHLSDWDF